MKLRVKGFTLSFSFPSLALLTLIVLSGFDGGYVMCMVSVVLHEIGHLTAMLLCGARVRGLRFTAFNFSIIEENRYSLSFQKDLVCTLSGPFFNLFLFVCFYAVLRDFAVINLCIGVFNLLPAASLDGGRALFLLLCRAFGYKRASNIVDGVTIITAALLFFIGIMVVLKSRYNFSLLFISLYLFLTVFLKKDKYI